MRVSLWKELLSLTRMISIQYASDLHINDFPGVPFSTLVTPVAPILILAGDICSAWDPLYKTFLTWCSRNWSSVILITGNHEYFVDGPVPKTLDQTDGHIRTLASSLRNIYFLQAGQSVRIPGTRIRCIGATLWSAIDPSIWSDLLGKGDYTHTYVSHGLGLRTTSPSDTTALHAFHKASLSSAIASHTPDETVIMITHHMPTFQLMQEEYKKSPYRSSYASTDDELIVPPVKVWICGHSHQASQWRAPSGTVCLMNARGYNSIKEQGRMTHRYNPAQTFTV